MLEEAEETVLVESEESPDDPDEPDEPDALDADEAAEDDAAVVGDLSKNPNELLLRWKNCEKFNSRSDGTLSSDSGSGLTVARSSGGVRGRSSAVLVRVSTQSSVNRIDSGRV